MPDITMCTNSSCKLSSKCYRSEKSGTKYNIYSQSFMEFNPVDDEKCDYFMEKR